MGYRTPARPAPREASFSGGNELDPPANPGDCSLVAALLGALRLHREPSQQRPAPPLRRCRLDRARTLLWTDRPGLQSHGRGDKARRGLFGRRARGSPGEKLGVRDFLRTCIRAQRFEPGTFVELQARGAHRAAKELRACEQVEPAGTRDFRFRERKFLLRDLRIACEVIALVLRERAARPELPIGRRGPARACSEQRSRGKDARSHGSVICVSRWNGHLRFISSTNPEILRMFASTSARNCARSAVAFFAFELTLCASASTASSFFRLPRTSPSSASACTTTLRVSSTTPPSPSTRWSVFASSVSRRVEVRSSEASSVLVRSIAPITFATCSSLPSIAP